MGAFFTFLTSIVDLLHELFTYSKDVASGNRPPDSVYENQLAARMIRRASDEAIRRELSKE